MPAAAIAIRRPRSAGHPYYLEDYVVQAQAFAAQLLSLVSEGVFVKFPGLKVVLTESRRHLAAGPGLAFGQDLARGADRGAMADQGAVRNHSPACPLHHAAVRRSAPCRADASPSRSVRLRRHSAVLHRLPALAFDGDDAVPEGIPPALLQKILFENPLKDIRPAGKKRAVVEREGRMNINVPCANGRPPPGPILDSSIAMSIRRSDRRPICIPSCRSAGSNTQRPSAHDRAYRSRPCRPIRA